MAADRSILDGCRVLVVEDEFFIADDVAQSLGASGAEVVGPVPTLAQALELLATERIHCAVVDINLRGQMAYPLADELKRRVVPFVFATGYDTAVVPREHSDVPCWQKPYSLDELVRIAEGRRR